MKTNLKDMVTRAWLAKRVKTEVEQEFADLQREAVEGFHASKTNRIEVAYEGDLLTGTLVEVVRGVLDEGLLEESLTKKQWEAISVRKLDRDLLEAYVLTGQIDAELVERCTEMKANAPFIKFTVKEGAAAVAAPPVRKKVRR
jgi:hypothetical protein